PEWLAVQAQLVSHPKYRQPGRPRPGAQPDRTVWQIEAHLSIDEAAVARVVRRKASFLVATNVLDPAHLCDPELIETSQDQHSVERGFSFLKAPLFLASSVFVKKPARIVALALVMVLCLLVYRLAEHRLRQHLAATGQTIPSQVNKPTNRPTMRWVFQCFEGISLVELQPPVGPQQPNIAGLEHLHELVIAILGPHCDILYKVAR